MNKIKKRNRDLIIAVGIAVILLITTLFVPGKITDATYGSKRAQSHVEQSGFRDVSHTKTGTNFIDRSECRQGIKDATSAQYEFTAIDLSGEKVNLLVCKRLLNDATIQLR